MNKFTLLIIAEFLGFIVFPASLILLYGNYVVDQLAEENKNLTTKDLFTKAAIKK